MLLIQERNNGMNNLLEVNNLSICFGSKNVVNDVSFSVRDGEVLGIVGESGSGKSVSALSILGLLSGAFYGANSSVKYKNQELIGLSEEKLRQIRGKDIAFIFQEPMSSLNPVHKVGKQIVESLVLHRHMSEIEAKKEAVRLMALTGIKRAKQKFNSFPFQLSGGQRQRVMIAMAIANHPNILIADEPTTALDVTVQAQIIHLLMDLKKKLNMSIIFISHDLRLVQKIADRICVMQNGRVVEIGTSQQIFNSPQNSYTKELIAASSLEDGSDGVRKTSSPCLLQGEKITVSYPLEKNIWGRVLSQNIILNQVSLLLKKGECLGIIGESGSGKTTLAFCLANLTTFKGQILLDGKSVNSLKNKDFRKRVQIVFQDPYTSLNPRMTVEQIVGEGLDIHFPTYSQDQKRQIVLKTLEDVGLNESILSKYPHEFSGGQRQRIAIARSLAVNPDILILDEPTSALDVTTQAQVLALLKEIQNKRCLSYIFISHDMNVIRAVAHRVAVLNHGKIVECDYTSNIFLHPKDDYTKKIIEASLI